MAAKNEKMYRDAEDYDIRAEGDEKERRFILSFSSEKPYKRFFGNEILSHTDGCANFKRLNEIGVVLYNHDRSKVVGKVLRAWIENNRGNAEIQFDDDPESEIIYQKVKNKTLKGVSVGYSVSRWESVAQGEKSADGRFKGPADIATSWEAFEISIVSVPADPDVGVNRELGATSEKNKALLDLFQMQINANKNYL